MTIGPFPATRFRRSAGETLVRRLVQENALGVDDLIWPVFIRDG